MILDIVKDNPNGFLRLVRRKAPHMLEVTKRSMTAWEIPFTDREFNAHSNSGNRPTRRWKEYGNQ